MEMRLVFIVLGFLGVAAVFYYGFGSLHGGDQKGNKAVISSNAQALRDYQAQLKTIPEE